MNLWAEFDNDNQHLPAESVGPVYHRHARRLTEQGILSSLRHWLLQRYVASYCRSLATTRIYRRCYWIDALGMGKTTILQPIAALSQELAQESRPIALYGIVLDARINNKGNRRKDKEGKETSKDKGEDLLQKDCVLPKESGIVHTSWTEIAPTLLKEIDQSPAIFLLNPFGTSLLAYDDLAPLYQRSAPSELCLLLSHKQLETQLNAARDTGNATEAAAITALLRTDRWKALLATGASVEGFIDLLLASMQRHFLSVQRIALPVQIRPAVVETVPYTLLFATRRQDSLASMNDAVCEYRRQLTEQSHRGVLVEEWFVAQQQEHIAIEREQLGRRIQQLGQAQRLRRWPDLRQQLIATNFGLYTLQEYDDVIDRLIANSQVRCEWRRRPTEPKENQKRIPGNEDTLLWRK